MSDLAEFLQANRLWALGLSVFSLVCFVGSLAAVPLLVARAPADYFVVETDRRAPWPRVVARNFVGLVLLLVGFLMLVLPGQGMLTVLAALSLLDFPGKRGLLRRLVRRPSVALALQWLRRRAHKPPFELP